MSSIRSDINFYTIFYVRFHSHVLTLFSFFGLIFMTWPGFNVFGLFLFLGIVSVYLFHFRI